MTNKKETKKPTSLELYHQAQMICSELEAREGVTDDDLDDFIDDFFEASADKLDQHRYAIDQFTMKAKMYRAEAARLSARARMVESIVGKIKGHAMHVMDARVLKDGWDAGRKVETDAGLVYLTQRKKLIIDDEDSFCDLNRHKPWVTYVPKIDKKQVLEALKADSDAVQLAHIEKAVSITFK
jgi:hypothetical protein